MPTDSFLDKIRTNLLFYLESKGIDTSKRIRCLNPDHEDKTPSMLCSQAEERGWRAWCCSCHFSADIFTAFSVLENKPFSGKEWFKEVVIPLASMYGVAVPHKELTVNDSFKYSLYRTYEKVIELIEKSPSKMAPFAHNYIACHSWDKETISKLGIGSLDYQTLSNNIAESELARLGLNRPDVFNRDNLIFPFRDSSGNAIRFFARTQDKEIKYNSTSTSHLLVDLWKRKGHLYLADLLLKKNSEAIIVEGQGDAISLLEAGFSNVIATCGANQITEAHINRLILVGISKIILMLDGDKAGRDSLYSLINKDFIKDSSINFEIVLLPDGYDPDSYVREKGYDGVKFLIDNASLSPFEFILSREDPSLPIESICDKTIPYIASAQSPIRKELMARELEAFLGSRVSLVSILEEVEKLDRHQTNERILKEKLIVDAACAEAKRNPISGREIFEEATKQLDTIDKQYQSQKGSMICLQRLYDSKKVEEINRVGGYKLGPGLHQLSDMLDGGRWTGGRVILVNGVRNVGKSTFVDNFLWEAIENPDNNAIAYILSIDDMFEIRSRRYISIALRDKTFTQNMVANPYMFSELIGDDSILEKREYGYSKVAEAIASGRLIIEDSKDGTTLGYIKKRIAALRKEYPDKNIIASVDNFHDSSDFSHLGDIEAISKKILYAKSRIAEEYNVLCLFTSEYVKLQDFSRPGTDSDIYGGRKIQYAPSLTIHLYSDIEHNKEKAILIHKYGDAILPRVVGSIGKNKITDKRLGSLNLDFFPASAFFEAVPYEQVIREEKLRKIELFGDEEAE
jgi:DNA primase